MKNQPNQSNYDVFIIPPNTNTKPRPCLSQEWREARHTIELLYENAELVASTKEIWDE